MLEVNEIFSSVQGEGRFLGRPSTFVRLARCNLHCVWCDTAYTWRFNDTFEHRSGLTYDPAKEIRKYTNSQVIAELERRTARHVIFTGGEPLLQAADLRNVLMFLSTDDRRDWTVEFETAGTIRPIEGAPMRVYYTVSPKLSNSGNDKAKRFRKAVLQQYVLREDAVFKFVVCDSLDISEVAWLVDEVGIPPERVYIMPEGTNVERINEVGRHIVDDVVARGFNMTTRLHVALWGNKRGV